MSAIKIPSSLKNKQTITNTEPAYIELPMTEMRHDRNSTSVTPNISLSTQDFHYRKFIKNCQSTSL